MLENLTNTSTKPPGNGSRIDTKMEDSCYFLNRFLGDVGNTVDVYIANIVLNGLLSMVAVLGNAALIVGIWKKPSLRSPSNVFLLSLAFSDLCVGLLVQPLYVTYKLAGLCGNTSLHCYSGIAFNVISNTVAATSILTLTAVSMDTYLKLVLHLRYPALVTMSRVKAVLAGVWLLSALFTFTWLWNLRVYYTVAICPFVLCPAAISFTYFKIYRIIRFHRRAISHLSVSHQTERSHKNSATSMFIVYVMFLACSLPFLFTLAAIFVVGRNTRTETAFNFAILLVFSNSTLNPMLICWRMKNIRDAALDVLSKLLPDTCCSQLRRTPVSSLPGTAEDPRI